MLATGVLVGILRSGYGARWLKDGVLTQLEKECGFELRFDRVSAQPFRARVIAEGLSSSRPSGLTWLTVDRIYLDLGFWELVSGRVRVEGLDVDGLQADLRMSESGWRDMPTCLGGGGSSEPTKIPDMEVGDLSIENARVHVEWPDGGTVDVSGVELRATGGEEVLWAELSAGSATVAIAGPAQGQGQLELKGRLLGPLNAPRRVQLDALDLDFAGVSISAVAGSRLDGPFSEAELRVRGELAGLIALAPELPPGQGRISLDLEGRLRGLDAGGQAHLRIDGLELGDKAIGGTVQVDARGDLGGVQIERVDVDLGAMGHVAARGQISVEPGFGARFSAETENLHFARFMAALGEKDVWVDFPATGSTKVAGTLLPLELEGPFDFDVPRLEVFDGPWHAPGPRRAERLLDVVPIEIGGRWTFTDSDVLIANAHLRTARSRGTTNARIHHSDPGSVAVDMHFERLNLDDLGAVAGIPFAGVGRVDGRLAGRFDNLGAQATMDLEGVAIADIPLGAASAEVTWDGGDALDVRSISGRLGSIRWLGDVGVSFEGESPVKVKGELLGGEVADLFLPLDIHLPAGALEGRVRGTFELDGPVDAWSGPVRLQLNRVSTYGQRLGAGGLSGRLVRGKVVMDRLTLAREGSEVAAEGWLEPESTALSLTATTRGLELGDIDALAASLDTLSGKLEANARLSGTLTALEGEVTARVEELGMGSKRFGAARARLDLTPGEARLRSSAPGLGASFDANLRLDADAIYDARLRLERSVAPELMAAVAGIDLRGKVSLEARLEGSALELGASSGTVDLEHLGMRGFGLEVETRAPTRLPVSAGVLRLDGLELRGSDLRLAASGVLGPGVFEMGLDGRLQLSPLSRWIPTLERASGLTTFSGRLLQGSSGLELLGMAEVAHGSMEWRGVPHRFTNLRGHLTFTRASVSIEDFSTRWAGGVIRGRGSMVLEDLVPNGMAFQVDVEGVRPNLALAWMDLSSRLDGHLEVGGAWPELTTRGELAVRDARVRPRTDLSEVVGAGTLVEAYDPTAELVELDIGLDLVDPVRVRNDDLDVRLSGGLRLTGTNERLGLLGSLSLARGGRVTALGRQYVTEGGVIELRDRYRIETRFDLSLSTTACDARILVNLVGDLSDVQTTQTSNPEMDREDISSCLVRGIRRRDLDQDLASFAGSALLKLSGVDKQVKRVIPIDQLDVTTEYSSRARAYEPRVTVAKDLNLLGRSARLEYSTSLLRSEDQRAAFRLRLSPSLGLQLGWTASEDVPMGDWGLDLEKRWEW